MAGTNSKKAPATRRRSTASSRATTASRQTKQQSFADVMRSLFAGKAGKILLICVVFLLVIGLDFLISFNSMDKFFITIGIEFILLVLIGWIRFVIRGRSEEQG